MERVALTLPGGGARAAYQAGALRAIAEIGDFKRFPFDIITGISAGAINGCWLAAGADDFSAATDKLWNIWKELSVHDVYKTDPLTLLGTAGNWLRNLSVGEWIGKSHVNSFLDTTPLANLLAERMDFDAIEANLQSGLIYGLAVSATDYTLGRAVTFFDASKKIGEWDSSLFTGRREKIRREHVMASAAIPTFFPPIRVGDSDYGDGGVGLQTPIAPSIRLGATRMIVIGILNPPTAPDEKKVTRFRKATIGDVAGVLLNSQFLNSFDSDVDRLMKMNELVAELGEDNKMGLREIPSLILRPSRDLSCLGVKEFKNFPFAVRHLLRGLGVTDRKGWDILSYLAFDKVYSNALLELGYSDTMAREKEVRDFFL